MWFTFAGVIKLADRNYRFITNPAEACAKGAVESPVYGCCSICELKDSCTKNQEISDAEYLEMLKKANEELAAERLQKLQKKK